MSMKRYSSLSFLVIVCLIVFPAVIKTQICLKATGRNGNLPSFFDRGDEERIGHAHQTIVTSYEFQCCGSISEWGADVYSNQISSNTDDDDDSSDDSSDGGNNNNNVVTQMFNIQFQVWRPSPTVGSDGCYSLVGENRVTSVTLSQGLIRETPSVAQRIEVQPGDVLGFRMEGQYPSANPGVALDSSYSRETVWYGNGAAGPLAHCPFPIGTSNSRGLRTFTNLGPLITVSLASAECPTQTTTSSMVQTPTTTSLYKLQQFSTPSPLASPTPDETTHTDHGNNELTIAEPVPTPLSTSSPASHITTQDTIIIICSGGGVVFILLVVLIVVGVVVCRRVNYNQKDNSKKALDPRVSHASMDYNYAYPSVHDLSKVNTQQDFSNSFYATNVIIDSSDPIYEDI